MTPVRFKRIPLFIIATAYAVGTTVQTQSKPTRLLFTGDILLSRQVVSELERRRISPWAHFADLFQSAQWVSGNLEGAFGPASKCQKPAALCFAIPEMATQLLKSGGFTGVTLENNHAADLGNAGRERTRSLLERAKLTAVDFENSARIVRIGDVRLALVSISLIPAADKRVQAIPSAEVSEKLHRAREQSDLVVVSIHWGTEYQRMPDAIQRKQARWLIQQGADVIVGHHPHVVQLPECVDGHPVFFSLGNHLFDQTYPPTKEGLIADCLADGGRVSCGGIRTHTDKGTTIPRPTGVDSSIQAALAACAPTIRKPVSQKQPRPHGDVTR